MYFQPEQAKNILYMYIEIFMGVLDLSVLLKWISHNITQDTIIKLDSNPQPLLTRTSMAMRNQSL